MKYWELVKVKGKSSVTANTNFNNTSTTTNKTSLTKEEVVNATSILMDYHDKYFSDMPLSGTSCEEILKNIPKSIYDVAMGLLGNNEPDAINPLYWIYFLCMENIDSASMGKFIIEAINSIPDDNYNRIENLADIYDESN